MSQASTSSDFCDQFRVAKTKSTQRYVGCVEGLYAFNAIQKGLVDNMRPGDLTPHGHEFERWLTDWQPIMSDETA